jgi:hypothetical protein
LKGDKFMPALNPVGSINESCSEGKLYFLSETDEFESEGGY